MVDNYDCSIWLQWLSSLYENLHCPCSRILWPSNSANAMILAKGGGMAPKAALPDLSARHVAAQHCQRYGSICNNCSCVMGASWNVRHSGSHTLHEWRCGSRKWCDASEIPLISSPDRIYLSDGLRTCNSCLLPMSPAMQFLPTSRRLVQFSNGRVAPDGARIVYIDGAFDVFHPGHVKILKVGKIILPPISSRSPPTCLTSSPLRRV